MKQRKHTAVLVLTLLAGIGSQVALAGTPEASAKSENGKLRHRVAKLESTVAELKDLVLRQADMLKQANTRSDKLAGVQQRYEMRKIMLKDAEKHQANNPGAFAVWSNLGIQLYGKVKLDASFDTSRTSTGDFARWVNSEDTNHDDGQFNMTANETRLGMKITGPSSDIVKTSGLIEVDFYGGSAENSPHPRMRHAYMKIEWPRERFSILAGQTWDVIAPLWPTTLNYSVQWWAGNIGFRRPQIRLTKSIRLGDSVDMKLEGALTRTLGDTTGFDPGDTGEDAGYPGVQGRASFTFPLFGGRKTTVGASGHFAGEEYDRDAAGGHSETYTWSANLDITCPVTDWLTIKGEIFTGQNLDTYVGGIGQGVDVDGGVTELRSSGGWIAASLGPWDKWRFNLGISGEMIADSDFDSVAGQSARTCNSTIFGNVLYQVNKNTTVGLEVSRWYTEYKNLSAGDSIRVQGSLIYSW